MGDKMRLTILLILLMIIGIADIKIILLGLIFIELVISIHKELDNNK